MNDMHGVNVALWIIAVCSVIATLKSFGIWRWMRATWQHWGGIDPVGTPAVAYDSETKGWAVEDNTILPSESPAWDGSGWEPVYHEGEVAEPEPEVKITRPKRKRRPKP